MSALLLWFSTVVLATPPPAHVLVTDPALLQGRAAAQLRRAVARPDAIVAAASGIDQLGDALRSRPDVCTAPVGEAVVADLGAYADENGVGELYVAVAFDDDAVLWRLDDARRDLVRVVGEPVARPVAGRVVALGGAKGFDGATAVDASSLEWSAALAQALAAHPNECAPEVDAGTSAGLAALHAAGSGDLHVAHGASLWWFDPGRGALRLVLR